MIAKYLWLIGSTLIVTLGIIHLYYTFFTGAFSSLNEKMIGEMKSSSPILSQEINMWNAWIGFNGSHSSGLIFIGLTNFYLALRHFSDLESNHFFFIFNILTIGFYLWLAVRYWFTIPVVGLSVVLVLFVVSYVLTMLSI